MKVPGSFSARPEEPRTLIFYFQSDMYLFSVETYKTLKRVSPFRARLYNPGGSYSWLGLISFFFRSLDFGGKER